MIGWIILAIVVATGVSIYLVYSSPNSLLRLYKFAKFILEATIQNLIRAYRFWKWLGFAFLFALGLLISFHNCFLALQILTPLLIFCSINIIEKLKHSKRKTLLEYQDLFFLPFSIYSSCLFVSILCRIMFTWEEYLPGPAIEKAFWLVTEVLTDWAFVDNLNLIFGYFVFGILWSVCVALVFRVENRKENFRDIFSGMVKSLPYPLLLWALAFNKETVWVSKLVSGTAEYPIPHLTSNFMEFLLFTSFFFFAESKWTQFKPYMRKIGISLSMIPLLKLTWLFFPFLSNLGNLFALPANLLQVYFLVLGSSVGIFLSKPVGKKLGSRKFHRVALLTFLILTFLIFSQLPSSFVGVRVVGFDGSLYEFFHWDFEELGILAILSIGFLAVLFHYWKEHTTSIRLVAKLILLLVLSTVLIYFYSTIKLVEYYPAWMWWKDFVWQIGISIMIILIFMFDQTRDDSSQTICDM